MTIKRLEQRCAARLRLNECLRMKGEACLMDAGSDWLDNLIAELETELRRTEVIE
ncbi:hypothetical protein [Paenibacillus macquariensis]|uniref:Spo0E like sporulation regulatory protein n=1 Tax=Paenibacillus macquariensis TaxID=948756 RepID=A0ABY1JS45_9BACL|nr:hypothetical protein [Paenibacillus macquariensis]MEC0092858.1 hypothetical protein [Paenibacillus macquariensis]SIQ67657.1 hypothetical protein SAMN05421578_103313 [Paenibacillus macquariensis]